MRASDPLTENEGSAARMARQHRPGRVRGWRASDKAAPRGALVLVRVVQHKPALDLRRRHGSSSVCSEDLDNPVSLRLKLGQVQA